MAFAAEPLSGPAANAVQQWFRSDLTLGCMNPQGTTVACGPANEASFQLFYGNADGGAGTPDAVALVVYLGDPTGNAQSASAAAFRQDSSGAYRFSRRLSGVLGVGVVPGSQVRFGGGKLSMTVVVARLNDAHCCPTGRKQITLSLR